MPSGSSLSGLALAGRTRGQDRKIGRDDLAVIQMCRDACARGRQPQTGRAQATQPPIGGQRGQQTGHIGPISCLAHKAGPGCFMPLARFGLH